MRNIITITLKELKSYFISPVAYVITTVFLIISGYIFYSKIIAFNLECFKLARFPAASANLNINLQVFISNFSTIITTIMYMMPLLTMRIFAEEKKNKTIELLMTSPVSISQIVFGKFLAAFILLAGMLFLTLYMPLYATMIHYTAGSLDWSPIITGYFGVLLLGSVFLAIGIFASALTENQIVAALISFAFILIIVLINIAQKYTEGTTAIVLNYISLTAHATNFFKGVVYSQDLIYLMSFITLGLFMTFRVIESKRWTQ